MAIGFRTTAVVSAREDGRGFYSENYAEEAAFEIASLERHRGALERLCGGSPLESKAGGH